MTKHRVPSLFASKLLEHVGHRIVIVTYGDPVVDVAVECEDCNEVLIDEEI